MSKSRELERPRACQPSQPERPKRPGQPIETAGAPTAAKCCLRGAQAAENPKESEAMRMPAGVVRQAISILVLKMPL